MHNELENILNMVSEYIDKRHSKKQWTPNEDWVKYAGPYYSSDEYVRATRTLLNEWLGLGEDAMAFEREFPKHFGKEHGVKQWIKQ